MRERPLNCSKSFEIKNGGQSLEFYHEMRDQFSTYKMHFGRTQMEENTVLTMVLANVDENQAQAKSLVKKHLYLSDKY